MLRQFTESLKRHPLRLAATSVAASVLLPVAILVPAGAASAASPPAAAAAAATKKPTIVLVHGAWANSSSWNGEVSRLQAAGYTVKSAADPLRGLSYDSAYLKDYLSTLSGPIILVGHSYGGSVITNAALGNKNVKALVYVDGYIPDKGQTAGALSGSNSALAPATTKPTSVFKLVPYPSAPPKVVDTYLLRSVFLKDFGPDLSTTRARHLYAEQSPTSLAAIGSPSGTPAWKTIPSYAIFGTADKIIVPSQLEAMAKHAGAKVTKVVGGSHLTLISHAAAVTALIESVAQARG